MNLPKMIASSIFFSLTLTVTGSYADIRPTSTQGAIAPSSATLYGSVSTCNFKNNLCGPAISIPQIFPSLTDSEFGYHIDAAVNIPGTKNKSYLFWNGYYREFNLDTLQPEGKPVTISNNWSGLSGTEFSKGINAAISDNKSNTIYLIKGENVVGCNASTRVCGQINKISEQWPSLTDSEFGYHIDAAANIPNTNKAYLFWNGYYRRFNLDTLQPEGKPVTINGNWPGLSGTEFTNKVTAALTDITHNAILLYSAKNIPGNMPGGGWQGCTSGCGTIGMAWADNYGQLVGHVTVDHLGGGVGGIIKSVAWNNIPAKELSIIKTTWEADIKMIEPIDEKNILPAIATSKGKSYIVSGWAREGDIVVGQRVCQSGWNKSTQSEGGIVCGTVTKVGPTDDCRAIGTGKSSCAVTFYNDAGFACGPGDSGAAVWSENPDGSVNLLGTVGAGGGNSCVFEPTYATSQIFGGRPYTK